MKLNIKDLTGNTISIRCTEESTLSELQGQVLDLLNIPVDKQRLVFAGEELSTPDRKLNEWGIQNESSVRIVAHLSPQPRRNSLTNAPSSSSSTPIDTTNNKTAPQATSTSESRDQLTIHSITPNSGPVSGGTRVVVGGAFGDDYSLLRCYFGPVEVKILRSQHDSLYVSAPPHPPGLVTVCVSDMQARLLSNQVPYVYVDPKAEPEKLVVPSTSCMPTMVTPVCKEIQITNLSTTK